MVGPYTENGEAVIDFPRIYGHEDETTQKQLQHKRNTLIEKLAEPGTNGDFDFETTFKTEEIFIDTYSSPHLAISGVVNDIYIGLTIPLRKGDPTLETLAKDLYSVLEPDINIDLTQSGMWLDAKDIKEKRLKTADGQGRINLGKQYNGQDVEIIVLDPHSTRPKK